MAIKINNGYGHANEENVVYFDKLTKTIYVGNGDSSKEPDEYGGNNSLDIEDDLIDSTNPPTSSAVKRSIDDVSTNLSELVEDTSANLTEKLASTKLSIQSTIDDVSTFAHNNARVYYYGYFVLYTDDLAAYNQTAYYVCIGVYSNTISQDIDVYTTMHNNVNAENSGFTMSYKYFLSSSDSNVYNHTSFISFGQTCSHICPMVKYYGTAYADAKDVYICPTGEANYIQIRSTYPKVKINNTEYTLTTSGTKIAVSGDSYIYPMSVSNLGPVNTSSYQTYYLSAFPGLSLSQYINVSSYSYVHFEAFTYLQLTLGSSAPTSFTFVNGTYCDNDRSVNVKYVDLYNNTGASQTYTFSGDALKSSISATISAGQHWIVQFTPIPKFAYPSSSYMQRQFMPQTIFSA